MENKTWAKFEKCKDYIYKKGLVTKTDKNWNFYIGNQWVGLNPSKIDAQNSLPSMNIIKPIVRYKASTVCQHAMTAAYSDVEGRAEYQSIYDKLNYMFAQSWEKGSMNACGRKIVKYGAIQGDSYAYWGGSTLEAPQILDNTSVLLGNENITDIQEQQDIFIVERLEAESVRKIAKENKVKKEDIAKIAPDAETKDVVLNKDEVDDKVTCVLHLSRDDDGVVCVERMTQGCVFEPKRRLESTVNGRSAQGLTKYPIVNFIWEDKPNDARGVSECEMLIPNQVEINKTLARRAITVQLMAYPRIAYDTSAIENPDDLEKVGAPIGVNGGGAQSINQAIAYLSAANISGDADKLFADLIGQTRELAGAGDVAMGNVNPERASGSAIIAIRDQSQVPLNEQVAAYQDFVEHVALLWFDMWLVYNSEELTAGTDLDWQTIAEMKPSVKIDVSQDNQWTKLAEQQAIDNLLAQQQITFDEYAELVPAGGAIPKAKLLTITAKRKEAPQEVPQEAPQELEQPLAEEAMNEYMELGEPQYSGPFNL